MQYTRQLSIEALQPRQLLHGDASGLEATFRDGTLSVTGTSGDDLIAVFQFGEQVRVRGIDRPFELEHLAEIVISAGAGDDRILLPSQTPLSVPLRVYGDAGNDDVLGGGANHDGFFGGPGDDIIYNFHGGDDQLLGGPGTDLILSRADAPGSMTYDLAEIYEALKTDVDVMKLRELVLLHEVYHDIRSEAFRCGRQANDQASQNKDSFCQAVLDGSVNRYRRHPDSVGFAIGGTASTSNDSVPGRIIGPSANDMLFGGAGNDVLFTPGGAGLALAGALMNDTVSGGSGSDVLFTPSSVGPTLGGFYDPGSVASATDPLKRALDLPPLTDGNSRLRSLTPHPEGDRLRGLSPNGDVTSHGSDSRDNSPVDAARFTIKRTVRPHARLRMMELSSDEPTPTVPHPVASVVPQSHFASRSHTGRARLGESITTPRQEAGSITDRYSRRESRESRIPRDVEHEEAVDDVLSKAQRRRDQRSTTEKPHWATVATTASATLLSAITVVAIAWDRVSRGHTKAQWEELFETDDGASLNEAAART